MAKLTVLLEDDLMHRFKLQALADRRSVSDVVRRFAEDYAGGVLAAGDPRKLEKKQEAGSQPMPRPRPDSGGRDSGGNASAPAASTCRRKHLHHINHGGNPCKECGWPT